MKPYIINATSILVNSTNQKNIQAIGKDLHSIKIKSKNIHEIVARGGCTIDAISSIEPNDIDLLYSYRSKNGLMTTSCVCEKIQEDINNLKFLYFKNKEIDLENSFEKEPKLPPVEKAVGFFSFHTDYHSQFIIDEKSQIWTNRDALKYFLNNIYEIRYEGFSPWAYFPRQTDSNNYWAFHLYILIRGIGYVLKRNLVPGVKFMTLLDEADYLMAMSIRQKDINEFRKYAKNKIKNRKNLDTFLNKFTQEPERNRLRKLFYKLI